MCKKKITEYDGSEINYLLCCRYSVISWRFNFIATPLQNYLPDDKDNKQPDQKGNYKDYGKDSKVASSRETFCNERKTQV